MPSPAIIPSLPARPRRCSLLPRAMLTHTHTHTHSLSLSLSTLDLRRDQRCRSTQGAWRTSLRNPLRRRNEKIHHHEERCDEIQCGVSGAVKSTATENRAAMFAVAGQRPAAAGKRTAKSVAAMDRRYSRWVPQPQLLHANEKTCPRTLEKQIQDGRITLMASEHVKDNKLTEGSSKSKKRLSSHAEKRGETVLEDCLVSCCELTLISTKEPKYHREKVEIKTEISQA